MTNNHVFKSLKERENETKLNKKKLEEVRFLTQRGNKIHWKVAGKILQMTTLEKLSEYGTVCVGSRMYQKRQGGGGGGGNRRQAWKGREKESECRQ